MIRRITVCLMFIASCVALNANDTGFAGIVRPTADTGDFKTIGLVCQLFPMPSSDPVRAAEIQERALLERAKQQEREVQARQEAQQRQFTVKFNQLVDAVASFAERYNEGKGTTWPQREAGKLREAMRQLQSLEKSWRDDPGKTPAQKQRASTDTPAR
jgi:hypothetical protein